MKKNINAAIIWLVFFIYLSVLIYTTFFNGLRNIYSVKDISIFDYAKQFTNLVPFRTISLYIKWILDEDRYNNSVPIINLSVNLILLFPMGYFLPKLIRPLKKFGLYFLVCSLLLVLIEIIQLFTRRGSFDVDDFILNIFGAIIGFWLFSLVGKVINTDNTEKKGRDR